VQASPPGLANGNIALLRQAGEVTRERANRDRLAFLGRSLVIMLIDAALHREGEERMLGGRGRLRLVHVSYGLRVCRGGDRRDGHPRSVTAPLYPL
jgi:hypothetical protein